MPVFKSGKIYERQSDGKIFVCTSDSANQNQDFEGVEVELSSVDIVGDKETIRKAGFTKRDKVKDSLNGNQQATKKK